MKEKSKNTPKKNPLPKIGKGSLTNPSEFLKTRYKQSLHSTIHQSLDYHEQCYNKCS